ncbi:hypothetical protein [Paenirhodobacter sp.]
MADKTGSRTLIATLTPPKGKPIFSTCRFRTLRPVSPAAAMERLTGR